MDIVCEKSRKELNVVYTFIHLAVILNILQSSSILGDYEMSWNIFTSKITRMKLRIYNNTYSLLYITLLTSTLIRVKIAIFAVYKTLPWKVITTLDQSCMHILYSIIFRY
jgi:hypothetical protein